MNERAHEESFLYHLIGAKDSFLQEINYALGLGVREHVVSEDNLRRALDKAKKKCKALDEIENLEDGKKGKQKKEGKHEKDRWLELAIWFRNQGTHRANIRRHFRRGGDVESTSFTDPSTGEAMEQTITEFLSDCFEKMVELLNRLRSTLPPWAP